MTRSHWPNESRHKRGYGAEWDKVRKLVLESGNPSAEHIENVLNRLKAAPPPGRVETHLTVSEPPIADTDRYDSLREEVSDA